MIEIKNCSLICVDTKNKIEALLAFDKSIRNIRFESYKFFTNDLSDYKISKFNNLSNINFEIIKIPTIKNKADYSKFCLSELKKYIDSDFCLTIQHDGYIIHQECWTDEFLKFDYIGAPWPENWGYRNRVGNGGFCLKSKKFLNESYDIFKHFNFQENLNRDKNDISVNEDFLACNIYYDEFIKRGIKFADIETASRFSIEHPIAEIKKETFGFHGNFIRR